jgi:hypothetical protein
MSHFVGARLGADSTQLITMEAVSRKLIFFGGGLRNDKKMGADF